ncbi:hypothetical protein SARC_16043, partial [Sphaeroforma arctica JP610]
MEMFLVLQAPKHTSGVGCTASGHEAQVGWVAWHPQSGVSHTASGVNLASCGHDGSVNLWSLEKEEPIAELKGHSQRVGRVAFHPS